MLYPSVIVLYDSSCNWPGLNDPVTSDLIDVAGSEEFGSLVEAALVPLGILGVKDGHAEWTVDFRRMSWYGL